MAKLWPWEARAPKWRWPILGHKMAILATFFEIWTSDLFCPLFTLILIYKLSLESIRPKSAFYSQKDSKNSPKWPYLKTPFRPSLNQKSVMISMCKIHIYIDSESFRQIRWKCRRSRLFGEWHLGEMGFWDMATLVSFWSLFGNRMADLGLIDSKLGLYIKINVNNGQNKFEVHISKNVAKMAILWPKIGQRHFWRARFPWP